MTQALLRQRGQQSNDKPSASKQLEASMERRSPDIPMAGLNSAERFYSSINLCIVVLAAALRAILFLGAPHLSDRLRLRPELSGPLSNINRLGEAFFNLDIGASPYAGSTFHMPVMALHLLRPVRFVDALYRQSMNISGPAYQHFSIVWLMFCTCLDIGTAWCIASIATTHYRVFPVRVRLPLGGHRRADANRKEGDASTVTGTSTSSTSAASSSSSFLSAPPSASHSIPLSTSTSTSTLTSTCSSPSQGPASPTCVEPVPSWLFSLILGTYLLLPFTILSTAGLSLASLPPFMLLVALSCIASVAPSFASSTIAGALLALAVSLDIHLVYVIPPSLLLAWRTYAGADARRLRLCFCVSLFASCCGIVVLSWPHLIDSYSASVLVHVYSTNIGLFWYFFIQIFPRFRTFFLCLFHSHVAVYVVSALARLPQYPLFIVWLVTALVGVFRPFPTVTDTAVTIAFLVAQYPLVRHYIGKLYILGIAFTQICVIGVTMWYLWMYTAGGNANFVFFQTILYSLISCLVIVEAAGAVRRLDIAVKGLDGEGDACDTDTNSDKEDVDCQRKGVKES